MMKTYRILWMCLLALSVCHPFRASATQLLFDQGHSDWKIVLSTTAAPAERYAASELQNTIRKLSGVELPILESNTPEGTQLILIGSPATTPHIAARQADLKLQESEIEQLAIYTLDGNLYLAGNQERGALYAVYQFLQRELDVHWFWPGEDGEFFEPKDSFSLQEGLAYNYQPPFRFRELSKCHIFDDTPTDIWYARNFLNSGATGEMVTTGAFHRISGGHLVALEHTDDLELFSQINGKRTKEGFAGCWSNPRFTELILSRLRAHIAASPSQKFIFNFFPADMGLRCECADCSINPDRSSRWYDYYALLTRELKKSFPEMQFAGIAYQEYRDVPTSTVQGLEYVEYCQYNRCNFHTLNNTDCPYNQEFLKELKRWQEKSLMGIYGYEFDAFDRDLYLPFWHMIGDAMRVYRDLKIVRVKTELVMRGLPEPDRAKRAQQITRLGYYIYAQTAWNPDADVDALVAKFCEKVYGPAAAELLAYHTTMAEAWDRLPGHLTFFWARPDGVARHLFTPERIAALRQHLENGRQAIAASDFSAARKERHTREVELEAQFLAAWVAIYEALPPENPVVEIPEFGIHDADAFDRTAPATPVTSKNGSHQDTEIKIYHDAEALHIQLVGSERDMATLRRGLSATADGNIWNDESVEIFLELNDGTPYRHFVVNPAGATYDAMGMDVSWNPVWSAETTTAADHYTTRVTIPFRSLGQTPAPGDEWKIIVIRNGLPEASAFPAVAHHDMNRSNRIRFVATTENP